MSKFYAKGSSVRAPCGTCGRLAALAAVASLAGACSSSGVRPESEPAVVAATALPPGEAVEEIPERAARDYERALGALRAGNMADAELELEQFVLEYPIYPGPYVNLAIVYAQDGRAEDARAAIDSALALDPGFAPANNRLGMLLRDTGAFADAEAAYRRALDRDPDYAAAHFNLGILLDIYLRRPADALEHFRAYQRLSPVPDETVSRWIVDLERRLRAAGAFVAQDE